MRMKWEGRFAGTGLLSAGFCSAKNETSMMIQVRSMAINYNSLQRNTFQGFFSQLIWKSGKLFTPNEFKSCVGFQCAIGIVFSGLMFWMFGYGIVMGDSHLATPFYGLGDVR